MTTHKGGNEPPAWFSNIRYWILRAYRAIEDHHDGIEVFLIVVTIFIATILFFQTKRQANIANDALTYQRLKDSADGEYQRWKDSINLAFAESSNVHTRRSLDLASRTAKATENAANATHQTVQITEKVAKSQMQPEIGIEAFPPELQEGNRFPVKVTIHNQGPTAQKFVSTTIMEVVPIDYVDTYFQRTWERPISNNLLPRNMSSDVYVSLDSTLDAKTMRGIKDGFMVICLRSLIGYTDAMGERQTLDFQNTYTFGRKTFIMHIARTPSR